MPKESRKLSEKLEALRSYRKAKNLCITCGDPWARGHKCPDKVPLHIMEELLEVLHLDEPPDPQHMSDSSSDEEVMLVTTALTPADTVRRRTIRLHGLIGKRSVLILVDSGANCSFVDGALVNELHLQPQDMPPAQYVIAGGATMTSSQWIPKLAWWTQGQTFQQDVKVLNLGADWLEDHSPMWAHWRKRMLRFTHEGRRVTLTGIQDNKTLCKPVSARKMQGLLRRGAVQQAIQVCAVHQEPELMSMDVSPAQFALPPEIKTLLAEFSVLFQEPTTLPPR